MPTRILQQISVLISCLIFALLRKHEALFGAGVIAKENRLRIDRDDGVAAGDRVAFADQINLPADLR